VGTHFFSVSKRKRLTGPIQALGMILVTIVVVIVISNATPGQTYALMSTSATVNAGSISTGNATLTIQGETDHIFSGLAVNQLLPGRSTVTGQPLNLQNTGTVPLLVTVGTTTFSTGSADLTSNLQFVVKQATTCTITSDTTAFPTSSATISIAAGQTLPICIAIGMKADAPSTVQGKTATFTIPLTAVQVRP